MDKTHFVSCVMKIVLDYVLKLAMKAKSKGEITIDQLIFYVDKTSL